MEVPIPSSSNIYSPLNEARREIRLLLFDYDYDYDYDYEQFIRLSLHTVSLDDKPVYGALSYEWRGHVDESHALARCVVDSHEIYPTRNLLLALSAIRNMYLSEFVWIDAICINQDDVKEREQQVQMMYSIYNNAFAIVVWLGQKQDQSDLAIELIGRYADFQHKYRRIPMRKNKMRSSRSFCSWVLPKLADERLADHWIALRKLWERSYWQRSWIVQELVVAHYPLRVGLCGFQSFWDLDMLKDFMIHLWELLWWPQPSLRARVRAVLAHPFSLEHRIRWLDSHWSIPDSSRRFLVGLFENAGSFRSTCVLIRKQQEEFSLRMHLLDLLVFCRRSTASDERDKVYSLLGLAKPYGIPLLQIDYSALWQEVYERTARYIIMGSGNLNILIYRGSTTLGLPF